MDINTLIEGVRKALAGKLTARAEAQGKIDAVRDACAAEENRAPSEEEATTVREAQAARAAVDTEIDALREQLAEYETEKARDEAIDKLQTELRGTGVELPGEDRSVRVSSEPRTYARETDPKGVKFFGDVARAFMGNPVAMNDLGAHMREERVERGAALDERAVGTSAFTGLVVPQYLTDMFAPVARAGRPFANAMRRHDLPSQGMVVNIGKLTTGTSTDTQSAEGAAVDETDADDTLLSIPVLTGAGQQTLSRQAVDRGVGIDDTIGEDLFRAYGTDLDQQVINRATTGLRNVATAITYTDASPTAAELYPKVVQTAAQVEAALLDQDPGDTIAVMHSRRWHWMQTQLTSTWPMFGQPGVAPQLGGTNFGERYGNGFRGVLPNGQAVIVDNNIGTAYGTGTDEDEIYGVAQSEAHLWEDPSAPMFIRAEQAKAANLQVLLVAYGYFAFTFERLAHAQKISGTGLTTPTF